ncbi:MAG TPA: L,D-transpeptidase [Longimicrobiaceae bacterium]|nr:L,D-transpeptidase [Longimicrobiaceae bacterium]
MTEPEPTLTSFRHDHPIFFWGVIAIVLLLLMGTVVVAVRIPAYMEQAERLEERMSDAELATRDRILDSKARRAQLAVALLRRELRLESMKEERIHLAISTADSMLYLRHGPATLRQAPVQIGADSTVKAPDGRTWRFVRSLGERHLEEKMSNSPYTIPEWVYISRGLPVPPESERAIEGGLGEFVLRLDDGTEIYTEPEAGPLAGEVKPASYMMSEDDMRAIFDAIKLDIPVYIY